MEELDGDWYGQLHDALLVVVEEQAGHDVASHLPRADSSIPVCKSEFSIFRVRMKKAECIKMSSN